MNFDIVIKVSSNVLFYHCPENSVKADLGCEDFKRMKDIYLMFQIQPNDHTTCVAWRC